MEWAWQIKGVVIIERGPRVSHFDMLDVGKSMEISMVLKGLEY